MNLAQWMRQADATPTTLAEALKISRQTVYNLLSGSKPKVDLMLKIQSLSKGKVKAQDWTG